MSLFAGAVDKKKEGAILVALIDLQDISTESFFVSKRSVLRKNNCVA